jgi:hypothetical protein
VWARVTAKALARLALLLLLLLVVAGHQYTLPSQRLDTQRSVRPNVVQLLRASSRENRRNRVYPNFAGVYAISPHQFFLTNQLDAALGKVSR